MIGGGGKIGGRGPIQPPPTTETATPTQKTTSAEPGAVAKKPGDKFERATSNASEKPSTRPDALRGGEISGTGDILKLARENPAGARRLVATMASQHANTLSEIDKALVGARNVLEKMGAEGYSKKALNEKGRELRAQRDKLVGLKRRMHAGARKMALLQQLAGKLGDPRLDEELERLLRHHQKLQTDWGRRHHLLDLGENLYGDDGDTPEHLRTVIRAEVRSHGNGEEVGDALNAISPRRVIAELIARTLDGSTTQEIDPGLGGRGEHGATLQSYSALREVLVDALGRDPFAKPEGG